MPTFGTEASNFMFKVRDSGLGVISPDSKAAAAVDKRNKQAAWIIRNKHALRRYIDSVSYGFIDIFKALGWTPDHAFITELLDELKAAISRKDQESVYEVLVKIEQSMAYWRNQARLTQEHADDNETAHLQCHRDIPVHPNRCRWA